MSNDSEIEVNDQNFIAIVFVVSSPVSCKTDIVIVSCFRHIMQFT